MTRFQGYLNSQFEANIQQFIVVSESYITSEKNLNFLCQQQVIGIQQPFEIVMQPSDINNKLISIPESTEVNSSTQTLGNPLIMSIKIIVRFINKIDT